MTSLPGGAAIDFPKLRRCIEQIVARAQAAQQRGRDGGAWRRLEGWFFPPLSGFPNASPTMGSVWHRPLLVYGVYAALQRLNAALLRGRGFERRQEGCVTCWVRKHPHQSAIAGAGASVAGRVEEEEGQEEAMVFFHGVGPGGGNPSSRNASA